MSDKTSTREAAIALLRGFDARLDAQPDYAARARAIPLPDLLLSLRRYIDESTLDAYLRAVEEHNLTWADLQVDVYTIAAEVIVGAVRR